MCAFSLNLTNWPTLLRSLIALISIVRLIAFGVLLDTFHHKKERKIPAPKPGQDKRTEGVECYQDATGVNRNVTWDGEMWKLN